MKNFIKIKNCSENRDDIKVGIVVFLCIERKILNIEATHRSLLAAIRRKKKEKFFDKLAQKLEGESVQDIVKSYSLTINFWFTTNKPGSMATIVHKISSNSQDFKTINFLIEAKKIRTKQNSFVRTKIIDWR